MLGSQRALFDIPRDVCYLNAAAFSPLPIATQEAGRAAVARKGQPWKLGRAFAEEQNERARSAAARLIGAEPSDVALIPSISYGVAAAGKVLAVPKGSRVLVLQDDHSSPIFEWQTRAEAQGFSVETVAQPRGWRLDRGDAGGDRAQGSRARQSRLVLLGALVRRRHDRPRRGWLPRSRRRARSSWSMRRTASA